MSADNGIYILKTKDQYRVIHAQAIENLSWTPLENYKYHLVPTRLVEYFGDSRYTRNPETAMKVATAMARSTPVLEYGIKTFEINLTWKQIVYKAKKLAPLELEALKKLNSKWYEREIKFLEKLIE
jgi:hypothetical protein